VYGSVTDEFPYGTNPVSKRNSAWMCRSQLKLWPFFDFFGPILAKIWLPWQRPLDLAIRNFFLGLVDHENPLLLVIAFLLSRRNAFMCIYSNICPKISCHGNAPLSLVYGSVTNEFPDGTNPISKPNSAWMCGLQLKLWPFCDFLAYFGQNSVAMATPLRPLQSEISSFDWSTRKNPLV